jgi:hypothetical protein
MSCFNSIDNQQLNVAMVQVSLLNAVAAKIAYQVENLL